MEENALLTMESTTSLLPTRCAVLCCAALKMASIRPSGTAPGQALSYLEMSPSMIWCYFQTSPVNLQRLSYQHLNKVLDL